MNYIITEPQDYGDHWDGWFGPSGRNETAPQAQLEVILQQILHSPAAVAIKKIYPQVYDDMKSLRMNAEVSVLLQCLNSVQ